MADDKTVRRGAEGTAHRNMEDDYKEHGDPRDTRRKIYRNNVFKDIHYDEDGDPDSKDNMKWAKDEHADMMKDGDADVLISTTSTARTTDTSSRAKGRDDSNDRQERARVERIEDVVGQEANDSDPGGNARARGKSKLARMYHDLTERVRKK